MQCHDKPTHHYSQSVTRAVPPQEQRCVCADPAFYKVELSEREQILALIIQPTNNGLKCLNASA